MLTVGDTVLLRLVEALDTVTQLRPAPTTGLLGLQNARPEKLRDVLQFVGGETQKKLPRLAPLLVGHDRTERLHQ